MIFLLLYLLKLSLGLVVIYLFYRLVLQRLTFYNWNRFYLLAYSLLCFFIPFIDISSLFYNQKENEVQVLQWIPSFDAAVEKTTVAQSTEYNWYILFYIIASGSLFILLKLSVQLFSYFRMKKKASLTPVDGIQLYSVNDDIIPFSFGNSIFIKAGMHSESELREIILHEFIHVRQKHSIDIVWSEILCILNWFNPAVWLLRSAIRQNLEFIADQKVLENGMDKKHYQYLLLKVTGNYQFSIANKFNFSSLKKRIAMMNSLRSAKPHLLRFIFILPLLAIVLVSFRKQIDKQLSSSEKSISSSQVVKTDTVPEVRKPNSKGYIINIRDNKGNCMVEIKGSNGKEVTKMLLTDWNARSGYFENMYGEIPPPPQVVPPVPPIPPGAPTVSSREQKERDAFYKKHPDIENIGYVYQNPTSNEVRIIHLIFKDGHTESFDLKKESDVKSLESKYGKLPAPNSIPILPAAPGKPVMVIPPVKKGVS